MGRGMPAGHSVSSAGDVNGDGLDDLIVGARAADPSNKLNAGKSYVVFGKKDNTNAIELSDIVAGTGGFVINGELIQWNRYLFYRIQHTISLHYIF
jgi:hypothetical protein